MIKTEVKLRVWTFKGFEELERNDDLNPSDCLLDENPGRSVL